MTGNALRLRGLRHAYGTRRVLSDIDVDVPAGTSLAVLGANGSGKTTLLRIAAGLRPPDAGTARLGDGTAVADARRAGRIGYIPQHLGLVRHATVLQNACLGGVRSLPWWRSLLGAMPPPLHAKAQEALASVGLAGHAESLVRDLSGGERQRVAIARLLVQGPDVVVADELVASLDVRQARQALGHLDALKAKGCAVVASLHNLPTALQWADQVAVLTPAGLRGPLPPSATSEEELRCLVEA